MHQTRSQIKRVYIKSALNKNGQKTRRQQLLYHINDDCNVTLYILGKKKVVMSEYNSNIIL